MADRILVVFYTKGGATESYAVIIAEELRSCGHEVDIVDLRKSRKPNLAPYDAVVVGTGVRHTRVYGKARKFLKRKDLAGKRLAIFLSSGIAVEDPEKSKQRFLEPLKERYGLSPVLCDPLPGKIPGERGTMQDTTDPELARQWARRLSGDLARRAGGLSTSSATS